MNGGLDGLHDKHEATVEANRERVISKLQAYSMASVAYGPFCKTENSLNLTEPTVKAGVLIS